jgi:hypothetical protein
MSAALNEERIRAFAAEVSAYVSVRQQLQKVSRRSRPQVRPRRQCDLVGAPRGAELAFICFTIAQAFPRVTPTADELVARFGLSRSAAFRYRGAMKAARGET